MKTQLQLILATVALTVLIWLYADQAGHEFYTTTPVPIRVTPPLDPDNPYRFYLANEERTKGRGFTVRPRLTLRGPKLAIRQLQKDDAQGRLQFDVRIPDELERGPQTLNLYEALDNSRVLLDRGLSLQAVTPRDVVFIVDRYTSVPVAVEADPGAYANQLVGGKPTITPAKVTARVLESQLEQIAELPPLRLPIADAITRQTEKRAGQQGDVGGTLTFPMPLESTWPGIDATFDPPSVQVSVTLEGGLERKRISPILLLGKWTSLTFERDYEIIWEDEALRTTFVWVEVPLAKVDQVANLAAKVRATVVIDKSDYSPDETWKSAEVHFEFPPGFKDLQVVERPPPVGFRLKKKTPPTEPVTGDSLGQ